MRRHPDSPIGPSQEEASIKSFWVVVVIMVIMAAALTIFRIRQSSEAATTTIRQETNDRVAIDVREGNSKARTPTYNSALGN